MADGVIVDQVAGFEIVGAVENQVHAVQQFLGVGGIEIGDNPGYANSGIDARQTPLGRNGFGHRIGGVGFFEKELPLQVAWLDVIAVDDREAAHAGPRQRHGLQAAEGAASGHHGVRGQQALLSRLADPGKQNLARISLPIARGHEITRW